MLVLLCHAEVPWAEGGFVGLDVFYVLSGFLITGLILGEYRKRGSISLRNFYGRRAKRLLPMASTVLVFIAVGSLILFPTVMQMETGKDILAAGLYFVNWRFIAEDIDYFAFSEGIVSPTQHYWSLSVEEQFYFLWPLLLLGCFALAARFLQRPFRVILVLTVSLALASLVYSIVYTPAEPLSAYFSTLTRGWEILFGAVLAIVLPRSFRLPGWLAGPLVVGGVAAVIIASFTFNEIDPYPGWRALIPVLGTVALIIGGTAVHRGIGIKLLGLPPLQYLGKISYAWYLWHWPFVVFAIAMWGEMGPGLLVLISLAAWVPAEISHRLIEEPFRRSRNLNLHPRRALAIGGVCMAAAVTAGLAISVDRIDVVEAPEERVAGALAAETGVPQQTVSAIRPSPERARDDRGHAYEKGCLISGTQTESGECRFTKAERPVKSVVLFGDSHALQYAPTFGRLARDRDWEVTVLTRGNCLVADTAYREYCDRWRANALERIEAEKPDLTVVSSSTLDRFRLKDGDRELSRIASQPRLIAGMERTLRRIKRASKDVVLIRDQPRAPFLPYECVADNTNKLEECVFDAKRRREWAFDYEAAKQAGVKIIDPVRKLCPKERCPSVIGDVLVYRDTYHLSATFARTLAPWIATKLPGVQG